MKKDWMKIIDFAFEKGKKEEKIRERAKCLLNHLLQAITQINFMRKGHKEDDVSLGKCITWSELQLDVHFPSQDEFSLLSRLITKYVKNPMEMLERRRIDMKEKSGSGLVKISKDEWISEILKIHACVLGAGSVICNIEGGPSRYPFHGKSHAWGDYVNLRPNIMTFCQSQVDFVSSVFPESCTKVSSCLIEIIGDLLSFYGYEDSIDMKHSVWFQQYLRVSRSNPIKAAQVKEECVLGLRDIGTEGHVMGSYYLLTERQQLISMLETHFMQRVSISTSYIPRQLCKRECKDGIYQSNFNRITDKAPHSLLILKLLKFSSHAYSQVRKKAQSTLSKVLKMYPWLLMPVVSPMIDILNSSNASYPNIRSSIHILLGTANLRFILRDSFLTNKLISALFHCFTSKHGIVESLPMDKQKKIQELLYLLPIEIFSNWRRLTSNGVESLPDLVITAKSISAWLNHNDKGVHWKRKMVLNLMLMTVQLMQPQSCLKEFHSDLQKSYIACIKSDVTPLKSLGLHMLTLHQITCLEYTTRRFAFEPLCEINPESRVTFQDVGDDKQFLESAIEDICLALVNNHREAQRAADGTVERNTRSQWSHGIGKVTSMLKAAVQASQPYIMPECPHGRSSFSRDHMVLIHLLSCRYGEAFSNSCADMAKNLLRSADANHQEKIIQTSAAAECLSGLCLAYHATDSVTSTLFNALDATNLKLIPMWQTCIIFSIVPNGTTFNKNTTGIWDFLAKKVLNKLTVLQNGTNESTTNNSVPAESFSDFVKWIRLLKPLLYELRGTNDKALRKKCVEFQKLCLPMLINRKTLSHAFVMCREEIGRLLFLLLTLIQEGENVSCFLDTYYSQIADIAEALSAPVSTISPSENADQNNRVAESLIYFLLGASEHSRCLNTNYVKAAALIIPILFEYRRHTSQDLKKTADFCIKHTSQLLKLPYNHLENMTVLLLRFTSSCNWYSRQAAYNFLAIFEANHYFVFSKNLNARIEKAMLTGLGDENLDVVKSASFALTGHIMLHENRYRGKESTRELLTNKFLKWSKKKLQKRKCPKNDSKSSSDKCGKRLRKRHAGVVGLCSVCLSFPYDLPDFLPSILVKVANHLGDPSPISHTAREALTKFKQTHQDNWERFMDKFTPDEWESINDILISPYYYT